MSFVVKQPCDEGVLLSTPAVAVCTRKAAPWVLTATILGSTMAFIDGTVVNVALAALQSDLNATATDVQWVVEAYALLLAALLLVGGSLGDIYGRRRIYVTGVILFASASIWCGLSRTVTELIYARAVQGVGAALLIPGSLAIIGAAFRKEERGRAIGTWAGFTSLTAALGPVIGGWLIEHKSWRWIFFINVPLAVIVVVLAFWRVPESRNPSEGTRVDWLGAGLVTAGLGGLVYGLIESSNRGWTDRLVMGVLLVGLLGLTAFVAVEARSRRPLLPLRLFRSRNFTGTNLLTLFLYGAMSGALFFFPLNLIQVQGYSATDAGAALLPFIFLMFLLSRFTGGFVERYGARLALVLGPVIASVGLFLFAVPSIGGSYWRTWFPAILVLAMGMAISVSPLTTVVMNAVGKEQTGIASGINNTISRVAALLSVATLGIVMLVSFGRNLERRLESIELTPAARYDLSNQRLRLAAAQVPAEVDIGVRTAIQQSLNESFVAGFRIVVLVASVLALAGALFAWLMIDGKT